MIPKQTPHIYTLQEGNHFAERNRAINILVKVIAWQIAWLNKECRDQVILLLGFDYTFFFYGLALVSSPTMSLSYFHFLFCRGLFSFELIRMVILRFSLLLFF
jgi:hypothetical protein